MPPPRRRKSYRRPKRPAIEPCAIGMTSHSRGRMLEQTHVHAAKVRNRCFACTRCDMLTRKHFESPCREHKVNRGADLPERVQRENRTNRGIADSVRGHGEHLSRACAAHSTPRLDGVRGTRLAPMKTSGTTVMTKARAQDYIWRRIEGRRQHAFGRGNDFSQLVRHGG